MSTVSGACGCLCVSAMYACAFVGVFLSLCVARSTCVNVRERGRERERERERERVSM